MKWVIQILEGKESGIKDNCVTLPRTNELRVWLNPLDRFGPYP
jgi:hypothetical protein